MGSKKEVLAVMRLRYGGRGRKGRSRLLDEFCELYGCEHKYAIKLLRGQRRAEGKTRRRSGAKPEYGSAERVVMKAIWLGSEQPCGKRLKETIPLWLPDYEREHGRVDRPVRQSVEGTPFFLH